MSKEAVGMIGLALTLVAAVFGFGMQIGTLTEQIEAQRRQIDTLSSDLRAINHHFIIWAAQHQEP